MDSFVADFHFKIKTVISANLQPFASIKKKKKLVRKKSTELVVVVSLLVNSKKSITRARTPSLVAASRHQPLRRSFPLPLTACD